MMDGWMGGGWCGWWMVDGGWLGANFRGGIRGGMNGTKKEQGKRRTTTTAAEKKTNETRGGQQSISQGQKRNKRDIKSINQSINQSTNEEIKPRTLFLSFLSVGVY